MKLVIGGSYQGKLNYGFGLLERQEIKRELYAAGGEDPYEQAFEKPIVYQLHLYIRRIQKEGSSVWTFIDDLIDRNPDAVIILDELGYGIVPIEPKDREYRELVGRAGQKLASCSQEVHRIICGIGTRIK